MSCEPPNKPVSNTGTNSSTHPGINIAQDSRAFESCATRSGDSWPEATEHLHIAEELGVVVEETTELPEEGIADRCRSRE